MDGFPALPDVNWYLFELTAPTGMEEHDRFLACGTSTHDAARAIEAGVASVSLIFARYVCGDPPYALDLDRWQITLLPRPTKGAVAWSSKQHRADLAARRAAAKEPT